MPRKKPDRTPARSKTSPIAPTTAQAGPSTPRTPFLKNPGQDDFRDPKVMWYAPQRKWVMALAAHDRVDFYASPDLKNWIKLSEFGGAPMRGAHGGVWECPDLFPLKDNQGRERWVLLVSINPGDPNGGSATQYFVGDFDGTNFTTDQSDTRWIDYGPDDYAGVTYSNAPRHRRIFIGWMGNWDYTPQSPTFPWRGAMTVPPPPPRTRAGERQRQRLLDVYAGRRAG